MVQKLGSNGSLVIFGSKIRVSRVSQYGSRIGNLKMQGKIGKNGGKQRNKQGRGKEEEGSINRRKGWMDSGCGLKLEEKWHW